MSFIEIEQEAMRLSDREKADLICKLIEALPAADLEVSEGEVAERERRLEAGQIEELSQDEFVRRVQAERGR